MIQQKFMTNIPFVASQQLTYQLPNVNILGIIIQHNTGTITGGTPGTYVANSVIASIQINENGVQKHDYNGNIYANAEPNGMIALQKFSEMRNQVASTDEFFEIKMFNPIPATVQTNLTFTFNTIANIQTSGGSGTAYDGTLDILLEVEDKGASANQIVVTSHRINYGTNTGTIVNYLDVTNSNKSVRGILGYIEDDGTASATAISNIVLANAKGVNILDKSVAQLTVASSHLSKTSFGAGYFYIKFASPLKVLPNYYQIKATIPSAGTNVNLNYWMLQQ